MRQLNTQELITVSGAGTAAGLPADPIAAITAALAAKGITVALDKTAGTVTVTTPKGAKVFTLPKLPVKTTPTTTA
jgi:hypothetical protein